MCRYVRTFSTKLSTAYEIGIGGFTNEYFGTVENLKNKIITLEGKTMSQEAYKESISLIPDLVCGSVEIFTYLPDPVDLCQRGLEGLKVLTEASRPVLTKENIKKEFSNTVKGMSTVLKPNAVNGILFTFTLDLREGKKGSLWLILMLKQARVRRGKLLF